MNPGQTCRILCGGHVISPPVPVINKDFIWIGGKKADGTFMPPGQSLRITIENPDYNALNGPEITLVGAFPKYTFTAPANNSQLVIGSTITITWKHSAWYELFNTDKLDLVLFHPASSYYETIAQVPVINDQFVWQVGKMNNGSTAPARDYLLDAESNDFHACHELNIKLIHALGNFHLLVKKIWIDKIPDCPMCFKLDPAQIKFDGAGPPIVDVELLRNGVVLAKLGRFGERRAAPGPVRIVLEQETRSGMIRRLQPKYELRFLSTKGEILHQEAIELEIAK
jgi:hypothetical protein